jgi:hypothetical protein
MRPRKTLEDSVGRKLKNVAKSHPLAIHCDRHGVTAYCLLCCHLREGTGLGYWAIKPEEKEPAQAWCEACDAVLEEDRGWTDRGTALADWKLYCSECYAETLTRHTLRGWDSGGSTPDGS